MRDTALARSGWCRRSDKESCTAGEVQRLRDLPGRYGIAVRLVRVVVVRAGGNYSQVNCFKPPFHLLLLQTEFAT